jgi:hypothetical protein
MYMNIILFFQLFFVYKSEELGLNTYWFPIKGDMLQFILVL